MFNKEGICYLKKEHIKPSFFLLRQHYIHKALLTFRRILIIWWNKYLSDGEGEIKYENK